MTHRRRFPAPRLALCAALLAAPPAIADDVKVLTPITVEGESGEAAKGPVDGYVATRSATGSKTDTPLIETPQSISVITRDQLDDRDVQTFSEALRYTPGIIAEPYGFEPRLSFLTLRGFDSATTGLFRDGLLLANPGYVVTYNPEPWGAERIEVPRGPASVLYGQGSPGGLVNYVSKRPTDAFFAEVGVEGGSHERKQGRFDVGGRLVESGALTFRLTGLLRDAETQLDFVEDDRQFLAPALTWRAGPDTTFTFLASYQQDDTKNSQAVPAAGSLFGNPNGKIPRSRYTGSLDVDDYDRTEYSLGYEVEHRVSDKIAFRQNARVNTVDLNDIVVYTTGVLADQRTITRSVFASSGELAGWTVDTQLQTDIDHRLANHSLLWGVDFQRLDLRSKQSIGAAANLDVFSPDYSAATTIPAPFKDDDTAQTQIGFYLQDQIHIGEHWVVTLGGRYDVASTETESRLFGTLTEQDDEAFTGRAGVVYLFDFGLAPYASYSESFLPAIGTDASGRPFDPELGRQYEVGAKYQPSGYDSFITVALFELTRKDFLQTDPASFLQVQTGEVRSRGIEMEGVASFDFGLDITASLTWMDLEVTESATPGQAGMRPTFSPERYASLWADYTVPTGMLAGLGVGAGVRYIGENYGDALNTLEIPSYTLFDAALHYDWNGLRLGLHAHNLFDKEFVGSCYFRGTSALCTYGESRAVRVSLDYRW
jgi:iron complex outermembrane receptor protein